MNLEEAMKAVACGNADALRILYEHFRVMVYSIALSIVRHKPTAEDIVQETFVRVYEKAGTYEAGTNLKAWILRITRNLAYDALRRENKQLAKSCAENETATETSIVRRLELIEALFQLGEVERQIVAMYVIAGLKHNEISEQLGIPAGTVRWKYRQSLSRLAEIMGGDQDERGAARLCTKK